MKDLSKAKDAENALLGIKKHNDGFFPHFLAMIEKEAIIYKRNLRRSLMEIALPIFIFLLLALGRHNIDPRREVPFSFSHNMTSYLTTMVPMPNAERLGMTKEKYDRKDLIVEAILQEYTDISGFYDFLNMTGQSRESNNAIQRWIADNCEATSINGERKAYGLIGS